MAELTLEDLGLPTGNDPIKIAPSTQDSTFDSQEVIQQGLKENPAEAKKNLILQEKTGLPLEEVKRDPAQAELTLQDILKGGPLTQKVMSESPDLVASFKDKDEPSWFEKSINYFRDIGTGASAAYRASDIATETVVPLSWKELKGQDLSDEENLRLDEANEQMGEENQIRQELDNDLFQSTFAETAGQIPILWEIGKVPTALTVGGAALGGAVSTWLFRNPFAGARVGARLSSIPARTSMVLSAGRLESAFAYDEFKRIERVQTMEDGSKKMVRIPKDEAKVAAVTVGGINMALEAVGTRYLLKMVPGGSRLIGETIKKQMTKNVAFREAMKRYAKGIVTTMASEGITEGLQEFSAALGGELLKFDVMDHVKGLRDSPVTGPKEGIVEVKINPAKLQEAISNMDWGRIFHAFVAGAQVGTAFGTVGPGVSKVASKTTKVLGNIAEKKFITDPRKARQEALKVETEKLDKEHQGEVKRFHELEVENAEMYEKSQDAQVYAGRLGKMAEMAKRVVKSAATSKIGRKVLRGYADENRTYTVSTNDWLDIAEGLGMSSSELSLRVFGNDVGTFSNAVVNGQEIVIPEATYFENVLASDLNDKFVPHLVVENQGVSANHGQEILGQRQKALDKIMQDRSGVKEKEAKGLVGKTVQKVKDTITQKKTKVNLKESPLDYQYELENKSLVKGLKKNGFDEVEVEGVYNELDQSHKINDREKETIRKSLESEKKGSLAYQEIYRKVLQMVTDKYKNSPYFSALKSLKGKMKLNRQEFKSYVGEDIYKIYRNQFDQITAEDGKSMDGVAFQIGFGTTQNMVMAITDNYITTEEMHEHINRDVEEAMSSTKAGKYIGLLGAFKRNSLIFRKANKVVRKVISKLKVKHGLSGFTIPTEKNINNQVEEQLKGFSLKQLNPASFKRASSQNLARAGKMLGKGRVGEAIDALVKKMINDRMYLRALEIQSKKLNHEAYLKDILSNAQKEISGKGKGKGLAYAENKVLQNILERFGLGSIKELLPYDVKGWYEGAVEAGFNIVLGESIVDGASVTNFEDLNHEGFEALVDAVKQINHIANLKNKFLAERKRVSFQDAKKQVTETIDSNKLKDKKKEDLTEEQIFINATKNKANHQMVLDYFVSMIRPQFLLERLQGNKFVGYVTEYIWNPLVKANQAKNVELETLFETLEKELSPELLKDWEKTIDFKGDFEPRWIDKIPFLKSKLATKKGVVALALNWGNIENRQRAMELFDKFGWDEARFEAFMDKHLNEKDKQVINNIWKKYENLWSRVYELDIRRKGIPPKRKELTPFTLGGVAMAGGYYPISYNYDSLAPKVQFDWSSDKSIQDQARQRSNIMTDDGHTKTVTDSYGQSLRLDLGVMYEGFEQIIHDLHMSEPIIDSGRMINDKGVANAIRDASTATHLRMLNKWLENVARGNFTPSTGVGKAIDWTRTRLTMAYMGFKYGVGLVQFTGLTVTSKELGKGYVAYGMKMVTIMDPHTTDEFIFGKDPSMKHRSQGGNVQREIKEIMRSGRKLTLEQKFAYDFIIQADKQVSKASWIGGYKKAKDGKVSGLDPRDEESVIRYAQSVVVKSQGSGEMLHLGNLQAGNAFERAITMFYTYFNVLFNQWRNSTYESGHFGITQSKMKQDGVAFNKRMLASANTYMLLFIFPFLYEKPVREGLPEADEDDSEKLKSFAWNFSKWFATGATEQFGGQFPLGRNILGHITKGFSPTYSPVFEIGKDMKKTWKLGPWAKKEDETFKEFYMNRKALEKAITASMFVRPMPTRQIINGVRAFDGFFNEKDKEIGERLLNFGIRGLRGRTQDD